MTTTPPRHVTRRDALGRCLGAGGTVAVAAFAPQALRATTSVGVVVHTQEGTLRGLATEKLNIFKGVRYGEAPTGALRFQKPLPVRPWKGIRSATQLGAPAMQDNPDLPIWQDPQKPSEDCLFLNVWAPRTPGPHPVMVFFHGGAFAWGSGGVPMYDGAALAEHGEVVVVTINHRINVFGYLYLAQLSSRYADGGNPGHRDLLEALHWIQRNIGEFGGDAENVTIFGESGGGAKVSLMLATPKAEGLFHKAIVQSGSALEIRTPDIATAEARALLSELAIPRDAAERIVEVPAEAVMRAYRTISNGPHGAGWLGLAFSPVLDPSTIPLQPVELESRKRWKHVPLLTGTTADEGVFFLAVEGGIPDLKSDQDVMTALVGAPVKMDPGRAQLLLAAMRASRPDATPQQLLVAIRSFDFFGSRALAQAELKGQLGGAPVYAYEFAWKEPCLGGAWSIHGADLPFMFDKLEVGPLYDESDTVKLRAQHDPEGLRYKLRDAVMDAWTSFARAGAPASSGLPDWLPYHNADRAVMRLDRTSELVRDPLGARLRALT